jgi:hypothetical protein
MKKGQIEIIGLVVIVIMLVVLLIVYFQFNLSNNNDNYLDEVRQNSQTSSFLAAFMKTTSPNVSDLLVRCGGGSCNELDRVVKEMMNEVYPSRKYSFEFKKDDSVIYSIKNCAETLPQRNKIKENNAIYEVGFWFC